MSRVPLPLPMMTASASRAKLRGAWDWTTTPFIEATRWAGHTIRACSSGLIDPIEHGRGDERIEFVEGFECKHRDPHMDSKVYRHRVAAGRSSLRYLAQTQKKP